MRVEQYVMAYRANQEQLKNLLPEGFELLRPVLRINAEILIDSKNAEESRRYNYIEFNVPVAGEGKRGWLNLGNWDSMSTDIRVACEAQRTSFIFGFPGMVEATGMVAGAYGAEATDALPAGSAEPMTEANLGKGVVLILSHERTGAVGGCPAEADNDGCFYAADTTYTFRPAEAITEAKEYTNCSFAWGIPKAFAETDDTSVPPLFRAMNIPCEEVLGAYRVCFDRTEADLHIYD